MLEMDAIYKRIWHAPNGHAYFGWFNKSYPDHLFDLTQLLDFLYTVSVPGELAGDINKLVIGYFLEATANVKRCTSEEEMFETAEPVAWFAKRLFECVEYDSDLIDEYKRAMGLPIETAQQELERHKWLNGY